VTAVATDHNEVALLFGGEAVDFLARLAVGQVAVFRGQFRVAAGEAVEAFAGLIELLLLEHRQVHRHVAAERHGHRFDDVHQGKLPATAGCQRLGAAHDRMTLVGQIDGHQDVLVRHEVFPPWMCVSY